MADTQYPFDVPTQTAVPAGPPENGFCNLTLLRQELLNSGLSAAAKDETTGLQGMTQDGTDLTITFANAISTPDEAVLDAVVLAHAGTITTANPKRVRMNPFNTAVTQDTGWDTKLQLDCPPIKHGVWSVKVRGELKLTDAANFDSGVADRAADMRLLIDGAERVNWVSAFADWHNMAVADDVKFKEGASPVFELQIRNRGASTAELRRGVISMVFVGSDEEED